jgi:uncharacterized protein (TIGR03118 family)
MLKVPLIITAVIGSAFLSLNPQIAIAQFAQTNLSSDISGLANFTDPNLKNPWGLSASPTSPFWGANQQSGNSTLHFGNGSQAPNPVTPLIVTVAGGPTGTVFNPGTGTGAFNNDNFLFSTFNGQIAGWRGALGTTAEILSLGNGGVYTGLAAANIGPNTYAYAANFLSGTIDVFGGTAAAPPLPGNFTDPNLPAGYAPFNIQTLNGQLFVTFAQQDANKTSAVVGPGLGFVDKFNVDGTLVSRLVSNGPLDAPWGLAIAPASFGPFGGDLLVGNHGDGSIWAFDPITGLLIGQLKDAQGNPIINLGLWALMFGNAGIGFSADTLYLNAGINGGVDGLFAEIQPTTPIPAALPLFASGAGVLGYLALRRKRKTN